MKWIEDRSENLQADSFARDYHIKAELAAKKDGKITALRIKTIADHGYADAAANPSKFPAGLFHICTGSYDLKAAHVEVDGVYTNKPPGGIAYRCSFRVTEAVHTIERMADMMAHQLEIDPAEFRFKNFIQPEQFPYKSALGWEYDSGNYGGALQKAMDMIGYAALRKEQAEKRARGELMGIGISSFTEIVGAGPSNTSTSSASRCSTAARSGSTRRAGRSRASGPNRRVRGTRRRTPRSSPRSSGSRPPTSRSRKATRTPRPTGSGPTPAAPRPSRARRRPWRRGRSGPKRARSPRTCSRRPRRTSSGSPGSSPSRARPSRAKTIQEIAFAAYTNHPQGMEAGLEAVSYYDPPNLTFPFGSYICVVDIDKGTGEVKIRRFVAIDDCGNIINPMIVEGQIHGGLTMGLAPALFEEISYDEGGNVRGGSFVDYLLPTAVETPKWETGHTITPSPHHPFGAKGVGESATVGAPAAIANAVVDALWHLGVRAHRHPDHAGQGLEAPPGPWCDGVGTPEATGSGRGPRRPRNQDGDDAVRSALLPLARGVPAPSQDADGGDCAPALPGEPELARDPSRRGVRRPALPRAYGEGSLFLLPLRGRARAADP